MVQVDVFCIYAKENISMHVSYMYSGKLKNSLNSKLHISLSATHTGKANERVLVALLSDRREMLPE